MGPPENIGNPKILWLLSIFPMNMASWRGELPSFQTPLRTLAPKKTPAVLKGGMILEALSESRMMRQVWRGVSSKAMDVSCHGHGKVVNNIMNTIMNNKVPGLHVAFHRSSQCCLLFYSKKGSSDIFWAANLDFYCPPVSSNMAGKSRKTWNQTVDFPAMVRNLDPYWRRLP